MWTIIVSIIVALIGGGIGCIFAMLAAKIGDDNVEILKNWLWLIIYKAEISYGEDTGVVKLHDVYNQFVKAFPKLAKKISFEMFEILVEQVLQEVEDNMNVHPSIAQKEES